MDQKTVRLQLRNLELEAQCSLAADASFLEALQCLKWEIDGNARVKAAMLALRDRGLKVFNSFAPKIRIRLLCGETVLELPKSGVGSHGPGTENFGSVNRMASEPLVQEMRDAASAVVVYSLRSRQLDGIVNEAVQANSAFERIASGMERAGYRVDICLDLSTYAQVRESGSPPVKPRGFQMSQVQKKKTRPAHPAATSRLSLSARDLEFLKDLQISPD